MMMTSRERVRNLLCGKPVDRVPNGLGGAETAGLHLLAYDRLKGILGVEDPRNRMTTFMTTALVEPSVLDAMEGDIILLSTRMCPSRFWGPGSEGEWKDQTFWGRTFQVARDWTFRHAPDGAIWWEDVNYKCPPGGIYFDPVPAEVDLFGDTTALPTPDDYHPTHDLPDEMLRDLEEAARWLYENTDYAIACGETITDLQLKPGGQVAWWMRLVDEPQVAHEFLAKACEAGLSQLRLVDQAVGQYADMLLIADDIGDVRGVTIGPDLWREMYKPHYQKLFSEWHETTRMKVHLHCCGSIYDILEDLIECGVDVLNPVQISARDMGPEKLKATCSGRIVFYGGCFDAVQTPPHTPAEDVYEAVVRNITALSQGGGYIFAAVHNVPGDTPQAHLRAMLQAYRDCRERPELRAAQ
jgi:uroporphyrinogen decarboxylase